MTAHVKEAHVEVKGLCVTARNAAGETFPIVSDIDFALKRRLMALMLLHHASDPLRHVCIDGWPDKAADLVQLQELIWPS